MSKMSAEEKKMLEVIKKANKLIKERRDGNPKTKQQIINELVKIVEEVTKNDNN